MLHVRSREAQLVNAWPGRASPGLTVFRTLTCKRLTRISPRIANMDKL